MKSYSIIVCSAVCSDKIAKCLSDGPCSSLMAGLLFLLLLGSADSFAFRHRKYRQSFNLFLKQSRWTPRCESLQVKKDNTASDAVAASRRREQKRGTLRPETKRAKPNEDHVTKQPRCPKGPSRGRHNLHLQGSNQIGLGSW